jgi:hypothetical protein
MMTATTTQSALEEKARECVRARKIRTNEYVHYYYDSAQNR